MAFVKIFLATLRIYCWIGGLHFGEYYKYSLVPVKGLSQDCRRRRNENAIETQLTR